ncbi:hypothetical protein [Anaerocolumna jejuensis]|uniref:hypothetical protein n=1 Tax=Anaerocolumna jejuensis TaxID=259063 RepID=UPI003F7C642C
MRNIERKRAEFLNSMSRDKAQYIVNAVRAYQNVQEGGEILIISTTLNYGKFISFVLQDIEEHENKGSRIIKDILPSVLEDKGR